MRRALVASTALTLAILVAPVAAQPPATAAPAAPARPPATAPTVTQALAQARSTRQAVPVDGATTPTDTVVANPDGSLTVTRAVRPVRKRVAGRWATLDPTLRLNPDGSVSPTVTTAGLRLSGGGRGPLATVTEAGRALSIGVPVSLPAPVLSGATATYRDILPGVDLTATADAQGGFQEVFVVRDATAAANPILARLRLSTTASGVTVRADAAGNLVAADPAGTPVFTAPAPIFWDSAVGRVTPSRTVPDRAGGAVDAATGQPVGSSAAGPGEGAHRARLAVAVTPGAITLTPDASMMASPALTYPLYYDPGWTPVVKSNSGWASVSEYNPSSNYWDRTPDPEGDMQVGNSGSMWSHTLINFPIPVSTLAGAAISSATIGLTEDWSFSCTASTVNLYAPSTTLAQSNATWNYWSGVNVGGVVASQKVAHGYNTSCPTGGVSFTVTSAIAADVAAGKTTQTFLMTGVNESSDHNSWKEFVANPSLTITYDHAPNTPTGTSTSPATPCPAGTPGTVGDGSVSLYAPVSDPDGDTLGVAFQLWKTDDPATILNSTDPNVLTYPSGSAAVDVLPQATLDGVAGGAVTEFSWHVQVTDTVFTSAWSTTCDFYFDPTRTGAPTVTPPATVAMGRSATFAISPPATGTTPSAYRYQLNATAPHTVSAAAGHATISIDPARFTNTLSVTSMSAGGNFGQTATIVFDATPPPAVADGDLTGDGRPELLTVGTGTGLPPGLWQAPGTGGGDVDPAASDIGAAGTGLGSNDPTSYTGTQVITGHFAGTGLQDVLVYYPTGSLVGNTAIIRANGDGSALDPINETILPTGTITDRNGVYPRQLVNVGDSAGTGLAYPDLLGITADGTGLDYYPDQDSTGGYGTTDATNATTPTGDTNWGNWTLATTQLSTGTAMFLRNQTTGALYLWTNLSFDGTSTLTYTPYTIAASGWNTGTPLTLQAADLNNNGVPDLWTVDAGGTATAWTVTSLAGGTATITAGHPQPLRTPNHAWNLSDHGVTAGAAATTAADSVTIASLPLSGTGAAAWNTGDTFSPDVALNGTTAALATTGPALATNADFTVSALVKPTSTGGVVTSQDGTNTAGFKVWAEPSDLSWRFAMSTSDIASPTLDIAAAPPGSVALGVWTSLTVNYTRSTGVMNLYVNGAHAASATHTTTWGAGGAFQVGDARTDTTTHGGYLAGQVADIATITRAVAGGTGWYALAGQWTMGDPAGSASIADTSGNNLPLAANGVTLGAAAPVLGTGTAATFAGTTTSYASAPTPVVDATRSFTVDFWTKAAAASTWATVVSAPAVHTNAFDFQVGANGANWAFDMEGSDVAAPAKYSATSTTAVAVGVWTHLTGVYDAVGGTLKLYVNGVLQATTAHVNTVAAVGDLQVGRQWYSDSFQNPFAGSVAALRVFGAALDPVTVATLGGPPQVAAYALDETGGTAAYDSSAYEHNATLCAGASFTTSGKHVGAVSLNGTNGCVTATNGPLIDTTQSFTVAAWVDPAVLGTGAFRTALSIDGVHTSAFYLQYRKDVQKWCITLAPVDTDTRDTSHSIFCASAAPIANTWTHLAVVYAATTHTAYLYVNGALAASGSFAYTWTPTGSLTIGRGWYTSAPSDWWQGQIDDVHVYQGALTAAQIAALAT